MPQTIKYEKDRLNTSSEIYNKIIKKNSVFIYFFIDNYSL